MKPLISIRLNSYLLPLLVGVLLILQLAENSRVWTVLLVGMGLALLLSTWWVYSLRHGLLLVREIRYGWAQVGDRLEERFTLENSSWAPGLYVEITDHSTIPDAHGGLVTSVGALSLQQWHIRVLCTRRGLYTLGPTTLQVSDPFGIYTVTQKYPAVTNLIVMPPIVPLPVIEVAPGGRSGEGRPRPNSPERTVSASGVREYTPGDSLHWIHWPTTARRDELFVRLLDGSPAGNWWIALDLDASVQAGQDWDATEEHGIILAASLADRGLRLKRAVGLVSNCQPVIWLPPAEGDGRRWEILRSLASARPGTTTLAELLARSQSAIGQRSSLILITPNVTGEWIPPLIQMLWRGVVPTVLLFDPVSFGRAPAGQASAQRAASLLAELGIAHYIFTRDMLDKPEARPGKAGGWEWRIAGRGRAVPVRKPGETPWKVLA